MFKTILVDFFSDKTKLLYSILILTLFVLPITYSRYIEQDSGSSTSSFAKWEVNVVGEENEELELVLENNVSSVNYSFEVTNTSNVACDYSIILSNIPNGISLMIDNDSTNIYTPTNGNIVVENLGGFDVNSLNDTNEHILTFISSGTSSVVSNTELDLQVDIQQRIRSDES